VGSFEHVAALWRHWRLLLRSFFQCLIYLNNSKRRSPSVLIFFFIRLRPGGQVVALSLLRSVFIWIPRHIHEKRSCTNGSRPWRQE
jgi:hypothetical protein